MSRRSKQWEDYLFFGGEMPSLMDGVPEVPQVQMNRALVIRPDKKDLVAEFEQALQNLQELTTYIYDLSIRIAKEKSPHDNL